MSGFSGADPDRLDALARLFEEAADDLRRILDETRSLADRAVWAGADADGFRRHVADDLGSSVVRSSEAVRSAAEDLRRNANQQRGVSAGSSADPAGPGVPGATSGSGPWLRGGPAIPVVASLALGFGASAGGTAAGSIGDIVLGGRVPPADWDASPRVAALLDLVGRAPVAHPDGVTLADLGAAAVAAVPAPAPLPQTLGSWGDQLLGEE